VVEKVKCGFWLCDFSFFVLQKTKSFALERLAMTIIFFYSFLFCIAQKRNKKV